MTSKGAAKKPTKKPVAKKRTTKPATRSKSARPNPTPTRSAPATNPARTHNYDGTVEISLFRSADGGPWQAIAESYPNRPRLHGSLDGKKFLCGRRVHEMNKDLPFDEHLEDMDGVCRQCMRYLKISRRAHPGWEEKLVQG